MSQPDRTSQATREAPAPDERRRDEADGPVARSDLAAVRASLAGAGDPDATSTAIAAVPTTRRAAFMRGLGSTLGNHQVGRLAAPAPVSLQARPRVSGPGDPREREADELADTMLASSGPVCVGRPADDDETAAAPAVLQRSAGPGAPAPDGLDLAGLEGAGSPLAPGERAYFEPRLGHDLGGVRVHVGARADELCDALAARAFALGHHVVLGADACAGGAGEGRRLLAHELVHVVQQGAAAPLFGPARPPAAAPTIQRAARGDVNTDTIKVIVDPKGVAHVVRVNKRGEIVAGLAEVTPARGEKADPAAILAEYDGRDYIADARTTIKLVVPRRYGVTVNPRHVVALRKGTDAEHKADSDAEKRAAELQSVLDYIDERLPELGLLYRLPGGPDPAAIASVTASEEYKSWALRRQLERAERASARAFLEAMDEARQINQRESGANIGVAPAMDERAITAALRSPAFQRWRAQQREAERDAEDARIAGLMRDRYAMDNLTVADAWDLWRGERREALQQFLGNARAGGVTRAQAEKLDRQALLDELETRGIDPEFAKDVWGNFQQRTYTPWEREQAARPGGLPVEVRDERGQLIGYQTVDFKELGLNGGVGSVTTRLLAADGRVLDTHVSTVLTPSVAFFNEMSRSVPILSHGIFLYEYFSADSLDLKDRYRGGRELSYGERLDRFLSVLPFADTGRMFAEAASGVSMSGADLDLVMQDIFTGTHTHARRLTDDERTGKLIMGATMFLLETHGPVKEHFMGDPHARPRWFNASDFDLKVRELKAGLYNKLAQARPGLTSGMLRLRVALELRIRSHLLDLNNNPAAAQARIASLHGVAPEAKGGGWLRERSAPREHIDALGPAPREHVQALGVRGVEVKLDASLGNGVAILFDNTRVGTVGRRVVVVTGPSASLADIAGHAKYVRLVQRFQGVMGLVRRCINALRRVRQAEPGELQFRVDAETLKLGERIQERARRIEWAEDVELRQLVQEIKKLYDHMADRRGMAEDPRRIAMPNLLDEDPKSGPPRASEEPQTHYQRASEPGEGYARAVDDLDAGTQRVLELFEEGQHSARQQRLLDIADEAAKPPPAAAIPTPQPPVWNGPRALRIDLTDAAGFIEAGYSAAARKLTIYMYEVVVRIAGARLGERLFEATLAAVKNNVLVLEGYLAGSNLRWLGEPGGTHLDSHWVRTAERFGFTDHVYDPQSHMITSRRPAAGDPGPHGGPPSSPAPGQHANAGGPPASPHHAPASPDAHAPPSSPDAHAPPANPNAHAPASPNAHAPPASPNAHAPPSSPNAHAPASPNAHAPPSSPNAHAPASPDAAHAPPASRSDAAGPASRDAIPPEALLDASHHNTLRADPALAREWAAIADELRRAIASTDAAAEARAWKRVEAFTRDRLGPAHTAHTTSLDPARRAFPAASARLDALEATLRAENPALCGAINDAAIAARDGRLTGFEDWLDEMGSRATLDASGAPTSQARARVVDAVAEVQAALHLLTDSPAGASVQFVPRGRTTAAAGARSYGQNSFDLHVEVPDHAGAQVTRRSEVFNEERNPVKAEVFAKGIAHGPSKLQGHHPAPTIVGAELESVVRVQWPPKDLPYRVFSGHDGRYVESLGPHTVEGDLARDIAGLLNSGAILGIDKFHRVSILDQHGQPIFAFANANPPGQHWAVAYRRP